MQTHPLKPISRRQALAYIAVAGPSFALSGVALAGPAEVAKRIDNITSGASGDNSLIMLDLPEIAENGNAVKVAFDIDSPMTADNYVKAVHILADGNPEPDVATFNFSPAMGACYATTRMRLSKQSLIERWVRLSTSIGRLYNHRPINVGLAHSAPVPCLH